MAKRGRAGAPQAAAGARTKQLELSAGPGGHSRIQQAEGDLWDWFDRGHRVVVTTNIGWHPESHRNNMGAGMALQAACRFPGDMHGRGDEVVAGTLPGLDFWYGSMCAQLGAETPVLAYPYEPRILCLPVKPLLDPRNPERSWDQEGDLGLIARGLLQLRGFKGKIALSYPGAGNGKLDPQLVGRVVEHVLGQDADPGRFTLVTFKPLEF